jgi:type I restriction enzyme S subunit
LLSQTVVENTVQTSERRLDAHFYNPIAQLALTNIKNCRCQVKSVGDVAKVLLAGGRLKRNYVDPAHGIPYLSGKNIVQIRPIDLKYLANVEKDETKDLLLEKGCLLVTRTGTVGRICYVWQNFENYAASDNILRIIPNSQFVDGGYLHAFLSSPYGHEQIVRFRCGSVVDMITDDQLRKVIVPLPDSLHQREIGNMVRLAYEKRAEAIRLEDEAQAILMDEITGGKRTKGT